MRRVPVGGAWLLINGKAATRRQIERDVLAVLSAGGMRGRVTARRKHGDVEVLCVTVE